MRLVCPNCGAQYEIDDRVLPEAGRDVQCSNCGHAWFQKSPDHDTDLADELGQEPPEQSAQTTFAPEPEPEHTAEPELEIEPEPEVEPETEVEPEQEFEPESETEPEVEPDEAFETDIEAEDDAEAEPEPETDRAIEAMLQAQAGDGAPQPQRQELDNEVRDVLREEADREIEARTHEREQIETQTDLGLEENTGADNNRRRTVRERMARLRGLDEDDTDTAVDNGTRRELLPDIEEINSSLESTADHAEYIPDGATDQSGRSGFRRGFLVMILLAVVVVVLYLYAPVLAQKWPAFEPVASAYVDAIDKVRAWVDSLMQMAITKMESLADNG